MRNLSINTASSASWLTKQLHLLRLKKLIASDTPPSRWYQRRKFADKEIREISHGQLALDPVQLYYHGDDRTHWVTHAACGNAFLMSLEQLRLEGPECACPFCHGGLLSRIGSVDRIFDYVYHVSKGQVLFIKNQQLGCTDNDHRFYHLGCHQPFEASFEYVVRQNLEGRGSGCTACRDTAMKPEAPA